MKKERSFHKPIRFWDWLFAALFAVLLYCMFLSWFEANQVLRNFQKSQSEINLGETSIQATDHPEVLWLGDTLAVRKY